MTVLSTDEDGDDLEYRYDFGDGNRTAWYGLETYGHIYSRRGNFILTVDVRDGNGGSSSSTMEVEVEGDLDIVEDDEDWINNWAIVYLLIALIALLVLALIIIVFLAIRPRNMNGVYEE